jgi:hypothetical protein
MHACSCSCLLYYAWKIFILYQIDHVAFVVISRAMIVRTADVGCTKGLTQSAFHIVQALRSIIPQAQPTQTGHVHYLYRTQVLCIVRGGQAAGVIRCYSCAASPRPGAVLPEASLFPT